MYQAIVVRYSNTGTSGQGRVTARAAGKRATFRWDYSKLDEDNYRHAAETLAKRLEWRDPLVGGWTKGSEEAVFVQVPRASKLGALIEVAANARPDGGALHQANITREVHRLANEVMDACR